MALSFFKALGAATGAGCRYLCALWEVWCVPDLGSACSQGWREAACRVWDPSSGAATDSRTLLGQTQSLWAEGQWDLVGYRWRMPCAELPQLHLSFAEAEQPPGQARHTLGVSRRCLGVLPAHARLLHTTAWQCLPPSQLSCRRLTGPSSVPVAQLVPSILSLLPPLS